MLTRLNALNKMATRLALHNLNDRLLLSEKIFKKISVFSYSSCVDATTNLSLAKKIDSNFYLKNKKIKHDSNRKTSFYSIFR